MAIRNLLHVNKLKDFESFLKSKGYMILPLSINPYEALRAKSGHDTIVVYRKSDAEEHLSIMDKDYDLVMEFLSENKELSNGDKIRNMNDEQLCIFLMNVYNTGQVDNTTGHPRELELNLLDWLESTSCANIFLDRGESV